MRCGSSASTPRVSRTQSAYSCQDPPLVPGHLRVASKARMCTSRPVEEPAIVRDDDGAAGERDQRLLERAKRVDVQVVGRLVEQEHVAARAEQLGEVQPVALTPGQVFDPLLLIRPREPEPRDVLPRVDLALARSCRSRRRSPSRRSCRLEPSPRLVDVREGDGVAEGEGRPSRAAPRRRSGR